MRELEVDLGIPKTTASKVLTQDLGMKHVMAKFIPQLLLPEQKEHCAVVERMVEIPRSQPLASFEGD